MICTLKFTAFSSNDGETYMYTSEFCFYTLQCVVLCYFNYVICLHRLLTIMERGH